MKARPDNDRTPARPLHFEPIYVAKPWGGNRLASVLGRNLPPGGPYGESWEISGYPDRVSRIPGGDSLADLALRDPEGLLGRPALAAEPFPLLFKFLDAGEPLSVQVHPRRAGARGARPKDEAWVVLSATPGAVLYLGLARDVAPDEIRERARDGTLPEVLHREPAIPGAFFHVSPGTIHSIGPGVFLAEIQQVSDTTYRLFDWGRRDDRGRPRELHMEEALGAATLSAVSRETIAPARAAIPGGERLLSGENFRIDRLRPGDSGVRVHAGGRFRIVTALAGRGRLVFPGGEEPLWPGRTLLLPAALEEATAAGENGELLLLRFEE